MKMRQLRAFVALSLIRTIDGASIIKAWHPQGRIRLFEERNHFVLVEIDRPKIGLVPIEQLEPTGSFGRGYIDASDCQPPAMFVPAPRIDNMKARSPHTKPCSMNGSITLYSSSGL
jgi:hypothetical protein